MRRTRRETFNPWTVVNLVFDHLAEQGLHPVLGEPGDPSAPAADLLRALGIEPAAEGNRQVMPRRPEHLATLRAAVLGRAVTGHTCLSVRPHDAPVPGVHRPQRPLSTEGDCP